MIQRPKGTYDIYGAESYKWLYIEDILYTLSDKYNYKYMRTPIFEAKELFHRGVGESTDIVTKETYDFLDRSNRELTLRPEGTAVVARSFIENKLYNDITTPGKYFYYGPMFRYERPQLGRNREFYQWGVEIYGSSDPMIDAEVISFGYNVFKIIGLDVELKINSIGDNESRTAYRKALVEYFKPSINELCEDCQKRLNTNPLRILDCKVDQGNELFNNAPVMHNYLTKDSKEYYEKLKKALEVLEVPYIEDYALVRGLDYYSQTVFEISTKEKELNAQNVVCGGGRYDKLVETLGGPDVPGIGLSFGIDRIIKVCDLANIELGTDNGIDVYIASIDEESKYSVLKLCQDIRMSGYSCDIDYLNKNLKGQLKQVSKLNPKYVIFIGNDEVKNNKLKIKDNITFEETEIDREEIIDFLDENI